MYYFCLFVLLASILLVKHENIPRLLGSVSFPHEKELIQDCFINLLYLSYNWHWHYKVMIALVISVRVFLPESDYGDIFSVNSFLKVLLLTQICKFSILYASDLIDTLHQVIFVIQAKFAIR